MEKEEKAVEFSEKKAVDVELDGLLKPDSINASALIGNVDSNEPSSEADFLENLLLVCQQHMSDI